MLNDLCPTTEHWIGTLCQIGHIFKQSYLKGNLHGKESIHRALCQDNTMSKENCIKRTLKCGQRTVCPEDSMSRELYVQRTLYPEETISIENYVQKKPCLKDTMSRGKFVQRAMCLEGTVSRGHYVQRALCRWDKTSERAKYGIIEYRKVWTVRSDCSGQSYPEPAGQTHLSTRV